MRPTICVVRLRWYPSPTTNFASPYSRRFHIARGRTHATETVNAIAPSAGAPPTPHRRHDAAANSTGTKTNSNCRFPRVYAPAAHTTPSTHAPSASRPKPASSSALFVRGEDPCEPSIGSDRIASQTARVTRYAESVSDITNRCHASMSGESPTSTSTTLASARGMSRMATRQAKNVVPSVRHDWMIANPIEKSPGNTQSAASRTPNPGTRGPSKPTSERSRMRRIAPAR